MKFIVDSHLPPLLAERLTAAGHQNWHIGDLTALDAADEAIWIIARERRCAIITKDSDFLRLSVARRGEVPILWLRIGNCGNVRLMDIVLGGIAVAAATFAAGERVVEIR